MQFIKEFSPAQPSRMMRREKAQARRDKDENSLDMHTGVPFEPNYVYKMLHALRSEDSSFTEEGRQEDAEEFLSLLLNGLNDEMLEVCYFFIFSYSSKYYSKSHMSSFKFEKSFKMTEFLKFTHYIKLKPKTGFSNPALTIILALWSTLIAPRASVGLSSRELVFSEKESCTSDVNTHFDKFGVTQFCLYGNKK